jgi:alkylmercury lyase
VCGMALRRRDIPARTPPLTLHWAGGFTVVDMPTDTPTLDTLVDALVGAFANMTADEQHLVVTAYRLLGGGAPVAVDVLAAAAGWSTADVEARLGGWPGGVYLDDNGRLEGLWGLAVQDVMPHWASLAGGAKVWFWCALDPLFILPALGSSAELHSVCPTTNQAIRVRVTPQEVTALEPASTVVSFLMPERDFTDEVRASFCHFVSFFALPEAADEYVAKHPGTFWVTLAEAGEVGRQLAARAFPELADDRDRVDGGQRV